MSALTVVALAVATGGMVGAAARPLVFARSVPAPGTPRTRCPHCLATVLTRSRVLLPLSGRCPQCEESIGPAAFSAEVAMAAAFAAVAVGGATGWFVAAQYWFATCGIALALTDLAVQRLPDVLTVPAGVGTFLLLSAASVAGEGGSLGRAFLAAVAVAAGYLLLAVFGGMGLGDVKLAPAIGLLLGWHSWTSLWWGTFAGFLLGALLGTALLIAGSDRRTRIPFGPFMIVGALAVSTAT